VPFSRTISRWVLARPKFFLIAGLALTFLLGAGVLRIEMNNDLKTTMAEDNPVRIALDELEEVFGSSETVVITLRHPELDAFDPKVLSDLRRTTQRLGRTRGVSRVQSLSTADRFLRDEDEQLVIEKIMESAPKTDEDAQAIRAATFADHDIRSAFLSVDEKTHAIYYDPKPTVSDEELLLGIREVTDRELPGYEVVVSGFATVRTSTDEIIKSDMITLMPLVSVVLLFVLFFALRTVSGVLLTLGLVFLSIVPAAGVMGLFGIPLSAQTNTFPILVLAISCGDAIHFLTVYYQKIRLGQEKRKAIGEVVEELALPIFLTSVTTAIAFLGLLGSPIPPMGGLGVVVAVGIMWAWLLSSFVLPSILLFLPVPKVPSAEKATRIEKFLEPLIAMTTRHVGLTAAIVILVVGGLAIVGLPRLERQVTPEMMFAEDHPARADALAVDEAFRSSAPVEILVNGDSRSPELIAGVHRFAAKVKELPNVGSVDSVAHVVSRIQETLTGVDGIPEDREMLAQSMLLYSISGSPDRFQRLVSTDGGALRITVRLPNLDHEPLEEALAGIRTAIDEELPGVDVKLTGKALMMSELSRLVLRSSLLSIFLSLGLVFLICAVLFRSVYEGIEGIVPLGVAILAVFGAMGILGIHLTIASALISSIVIGVGVDYGIHILARWDLLEGHPHESRLAATIHEVGRPILFNACAVAGGLSVLALSNFEPIRKLGLISVVAMGAAAFGALIIIPLFKTLRKKEPAHEKLAS
jgi:uncharacterized protein